ncbi:MAG: PaaI family thioesterase [Actinobacteria bacterium]|nr:PaaI family thioesterase [Actinomycetota bacterium]
MIPDEPARGAYPELELFGLTGYEQMRVWKERMGPTPPGGKIAGGILEDFNFQSATFVSPASPWFATSPGLFSGATGLLPGDVAMGSAILVGLPPATGFATAQIALSFVRPASVDSGVLRATSTLIHVSPALGLADLVVEDAGGRLLCHGTCRQVIFPPLDPGPKPLDTFPPVEETTYETPDPLDRPPEGELLPQEVFDRYSGLELQQRHVAGKVPTAPIGALLGWRPKLAEQGRVAGTIPASEWFASATRTVYGGILGLLTADARVVHAGKQIVVVNVDVTNADGKVVLIGKSTVMLLPDRKWADTVHAASEHPATDSSG